MMGICAPPMNLLPAMLGFLMTVGAAWRDAWLLVRGVREADYPAGTLWVMRGIRDGIVALGLGALTGGVLVANKGLLVFGAIFLGEELYETGVVLPALRARLKASKTPYPAGRGAGGTAIDRDLTGPGVRARSPQSPRMPTSKTSHVRHDSVRSAPHGHAIDPLGQMVQRPLHEHHIHTGIMP